MIATRLMLFSCSTDGQFKIWCLNSWECKHILEPIDFVPYCMAASNEFVVSGECSTLGGGMGRICAWSSPNAMTTWEAHEKTVSALEFSGNHLYRYSAL
jgi:hypothetical protein